MGRLLTRWINPNKRKFRRNSSTVPVAGLSSVGTFDTEGQFYDFIDEYVTDDGIPFYISVSEPEEGSDLEYAYLLPYVADFIDAEPDYNTMWEPEYKDYKVAIDFRNRKPQAKSKILDTILAKGLPAAFGAGKSQSIETQQIDESESQSISEPESSTLGQKPFWLTVTVDAFNSLTAYRGKKEKLKDKGISSFYFSFGTQAKAYKLSAFAFGEQITLLPILREYKFKGIEKKLGKKPSKKDYLFLPISTTQPEAGKLTLIKVYPPMTLDQAGIYFLDTYKRWTKKTRARKAKFEPAKSLDKYGLDSNNKYGLGLDYVQMTNFKLYLDQNDLVIDAVAATLNPDEIQQEAIEKDKRFHLRLIRKLVETGLYGTYVSLISGHKGSKLFYPQSIENGLVLDEIPLNEYTNVFAIVGEFDRLILDVIDFKYALIPPHLGVEFARFVRKRIKDFPEETKKNKGESILNNSKNQELIEELARKGGQLVKQADESAEQSIAEPPKSMQIVKFTDFEPEQLYKGWRWTNNSWESTGFPTEKGSQQTPSNWNQYVEYFKGRRDSKTAVFPAGYTPTTERYIEPETYSPPASTTQSTQITNINQLDPDGDYKLWTYDPNFNSWGSGLSAKGSQFINKWDKIVERNEQQVTKKAIFHFNDDPSHAKVEYAQMEPNLVENGEEIPVEKINWDTGKLKRIKRYSLLEQFNPVYLYEGAEGQSFYITSVDWQDLGKLYYVVPPSENPLEYPFDYQTEGIAFDYKLKDLIKSIENNGLSYKLYDPQAILHNDDFQYEIYSDYRVWKTFLDYANVTWYGSPEVFEDEEVFSSADWQNAVKYGVEFKWKDFNFYKFDDGTYRKRKATFHPKNAQSELSVVYEFLKWLEEKKSKGMAQFLEHTTLETIFGEGDYPSVQEIKAHFESKDTVQDADTEPVIIEEKMEVQTESPVQESIGSWSFNYDDCSIRFERMQVK